MKRKSHGALRESLECYMNLNGCGWEIHNIYKPQRKILYFATVKNVIFISSFAPDASEIGKKRPEKFASCARCE